MRTKRPESIATNGVTEPAGAVPRTVRGVPAKDTQEDALPLNTTACAAALSAMSQRQDNVGRLPPANRTERAGHLRAARPRTVHPIDSFDKTGRLTLESFDSRAVRTDCNACMRYNDRMVAHRFVVAGSAVGCFSCPQELYGAIRGGRAKRHAHLAVDSAWAPTLNANGENFRRRGVRFQGCRC